mgnify:FL=1
MNSVWGYGGISFKFAVSGTYEASASFYGQSVSNSTADAKITYKPIYLRKENIDRKIVEKFLGNRVEIEVELLNILASDYSQIRVLIGFFNRISESETMLSLRVNTTDGTDGLFIEDVALMSDISFDQLHKLEIGQKIKLKFAKKELVQSISNMTREDTIDYMIDETSDYIIDENGDKIII